MINETGQRVYTIHYSDSSSNRPLFNHNEHFNVKTGKKKKTRVNYTDTRRLVKLDSLHPIFNK